MKIVIAAGGTGGHIFPALVVAQQLRKHCNEIDLLWIGTNRSREIELAKKNSIPLEIINVSGLQRNTFFSAFKAIGQFIAAFFKIYKLFGKENPHAVIAFGGYVCAPVLAVAYIRSIVFFIQEQNTVPGLVNRIFAPAARCVFLGFPLHGKYNLKGNIKLSGNPVRQCRENFEQFEYPKGFIKGKTTILVCGGSQGALSMNRCLTGALIELIREGLQIVWQTGEAGYKEILQMLSNYPSAFVFNSIDDLYPYYAVAKLVICRSGASTLAEVAYFGLPCITIPLPWAAADHQRLNAAVVEHQGWGIKIEQNGDCGMRVKKAVESILKNPDVWEKMSRKALDNNSAEAASIIATSVLETIMR